VQDVLAHLAERGFTNVEEFEPVTEKIAFSLPRELAKDLKAAGRA
jgi:4-hydroxy-3-methylbut-2-en-1-yl diphosphate reductase